MQANQADTGGGFFLQELKGSTEIRRCAVLNNTANYVRAMHLFSAHEPSVMRLSDVASGCPPANDSGAMSYLADAEWWRLLTCAQ